MSLGANRIEPWRLIKMTLRHRTIKHVENDTKNKLVKGWLEQSDHFTVVMKRKFYGATSIAQDSRSEGSGSFSWDVGRGRILTTTVTSKIGKPKWYCTLDDIDILDHIVGEGEQTQVWELQSRSEPVRDSYFELPVEGEDNNSGGG